MLLKHGAKIDDKFCGTFGDLACFSFFQVKTLVHSAMQALSLEIIKDL